MTHVQSNDITTVEPGARNPAAAVAARAVVIAPGSAMELGGMAALAHSLHVLSLAMDELRARLGAQLQLNAIDVSALIEVYNRPDIRPTDLGRALNIRSAGLTALADRLVRRGFLVRSPDPSDRRGSRLRLTPAGARATGWIFDSVTAALREHITVDVDTTSGNLIELARALDQV